MINVQEFLKTYQNGSFTKVVLERKAKVKVAYKHLNIVKVTRLIARLGVNYDNLSQTETNREEGKAPKENAGLTWGEWKHYPFLIKHKEEEYLRIYANKNQTKVDWFVDGVKVKKDSLKLMLLSSETSKPTEDNYLTLSTKVSNVVSLG
jgi:hypothetical protein